MSICRVHCVKTPNALMLRMSGEQVRLQVPQKLYRVHSWITQIIRQWVPNCGSGDRKCQSLKGAALNMWYRQLMTSGWSQTVTTGNCGNWHAVVGEIRCSPMPETTSLRWTVAASLYCTRWGTLSQCRSSCIYRNRPRSYFWVPVTKVKTQIVWLSRCFKLQC